MLTRLMIVAVCFASPGIAQGQLQKKAAAYLDARAQSWLDWPHAARGSKTSCISCHTALPYALARPLLSKSLGESKIPAAEKKLVANVRRRASMWSAIRKEKDIRAYYNGAKLKEALGTESVINALVLINFDRHRNNGRLSDSARKALANMSEQQRDDGSWDWLDFGLRPWETEGKYFGGALAAMAYGISGEAEKPAHKPHVAALRKHLTSHFAGENLHNRAIAVWASGSLSGILPKDAKKSLQAELWKLQNADGGWSLVKFAKKPNNTTAWVSRADHPAGAISNTYATAIAVLALRRTGVKNDDPRMKKAIALLSAQQKSANWTISYLNRKRDPAEFRGKFFRDAAAAYASLALCEAR